MAFLRAAGGERRSFELHTYTPVGRAKPGEFQLRHGGADNKEEEKIPQGEAFDNPEICLCGGPFK